MHLAHEVVSVGDCMYLPLPIDRGTCLAPVPMGASRWIPVSFRCYVLSMDNETNRAVVDGVVRQQPPIRKAPR